ncbi:MAG: restriction endonuclease subunit S [Mesorhizobium sp.]
MDEWHTVTVDEVATDVTVGHVGPMAGEYQDEGIPFLRSLNVEPFVIRTEGLKYISGEFHNRLRKSALRPGDVVIVRTGKPGACAVIPDWLEDANCSDLVIVRCGERIRPRFLAYVVNSLAGHHVSSHTVGAVQQHFNVGSARTLSFQLPSISSQDTILEILGALDDKIELNRRMNETLEGMARAIFRDWFVDFGPTRAKQEGREPYLASDIWSVFPDRLDDEGKPEGWRNSTVGREFNLVMGQSPPGETYNEDEDGLPFFQGRTDFGFRYPVRRKFCSAPSRLAQEDDTLVSVRAPVGDLNMAWERCCIGRGVAAARHKDGGRGFTYYSLYSMQPAIQRFEDSGSVFGAINKAQFERLTVLDPGNLSIQAFELAVQAMDDRIRSNTSESQILAATRDLLLPRLMSGEIRIRKAEKIVGTAP